MSFDKQSLQKLKYLILLIILSISGYVHCGEVIPSSDLVSICGINNQGSLLKGYTNPEVERLFLNSTEINITNGQFIISFDRDARLANNLTLILANGDNFTIPYQLNRREYQIDRIDRLQQSYVSGKTDPEWITRVNTEALNLKKAWKKIFQNKERYFTTFVRSVSGGRISSQFGSQRILNGTPKKPHGGTDIAVPRGTQVLATSDGIIALAGDYYYVGKFVLIDHGLGLGTLYAHLDTVLVETGEYVTHGTIVGQVGSTGRSTGPHLHWEARHNGNRLDPLTMLVKEEEIFSIKFSE